MRWTLLLPLMLLSLVTIVTAVRSDPVAGRRSVTRTYVLDASSARGITMRIRAGDVVTISALGEVITNSDLNSRLAADKWTDPNGIDDCEYAARPECHKLPFMALIGRTGEDYFMVGKTFKRAFDRPAVLALLVNDFIYDDNQGSFEIKVTIESE